MEQHILIIGHVWPEPSTTAAGHRMLQLIASFLAYNKPVTFATTATKTEHSYDLETLGVATASIQLNHASFDEFVKGLNPQYVIFDRFMVEEQFGWRVAQQVPEAVRILNTEDLHSLRKTREWCHKKEKEFTISFWKQQDITKREIASIYRSDLSLMVSTYEIELLSDEIQVPINLTYHLPFMMDDISETTQKQWPEFEERCDFITYGNGKHAPNVDAINYLQKNIWPRIRKTLPDASLKIFGAYLPQQITEMHNPKEGFHVMGWAENLDEEIQKTRVVLAPLRFGAGIKGKIIDALKNGTPVVSTKVGVEGMSLQALQLVEADTPEAFVKEAIQLYTDRKAWYASQKKGITAINTQYSKRKLQEEFHQKLVEMHQNLGTHRSQNFIGALLQHQTMAATKYMGKWIEEKHRK